MQPAGKPAIRLASAGKRHHNWANCPGARWSPVKAPLAVVLLVHCETFVGLDSAAMSTLSQMPCPHLGRGRCTA